MLPEKVTNDLIHKPELQTLQQTIDYVLLDIRRWQDQSIAKIHEHQFAQSLGTGPKGPVMPRLEAETVMAPKEIQDGKLAELQSKLDNLVAAINTRRPPARRQSPGGGGGARTPTQQSRSGLPRPDPTFKGCWHCGDPNHSRTNGRDKNRAVQCPKFKD